MRTGESDENMKEKEEKMGERDEMEVRLQSSGHGHGGGGCVHISLEEVKSFYRFSQSCQRLHNDIMQQESDRLFAADIDPDLRKRFAFLSGGRAENGSPIIVFPEFPAFGELQEEEFHNVLTYLTSVPSVTASGVGFILVIDRRQDRWTAVKGTLLRIAGSFPVHLQLVLVLRPSTLFQRTLSDIFFKFNRDEFKMKVPVVMLSSVTELHAYIDRTQLPQELGGTQDYCHDTWISHRTVSTLLPYPSHQTPDRLHRAQSQHDTWISHRTAIEAFALMVKTTAQTLQSFGTELAETELPNDAQATSNLLATHSEKKGQMKEDLCVALGQGGRLLESINEPLQREPDYTMNQDELENLATVQRLLGQLDETETAFDDFWERHQTKLEQCLQLRHFEYYFREVRAQLDVVSERVEAFSEVGISPAHAEHILRELNSQEEKACDVLDWALSLAAEGDGLIESAHYAEDSILPKCSELRAVCDEVTSFLKSKKVLLLRAMELHHCLEKASRWCEEGIYLLASQPVDRCQSQDGAEAALQELEKYLDTAAQHQITDLKAIWRDYDSILNPELREQVEKVFQKQVSMQEMFEKRRVSLKKLAAKQTRPVQPVAPRPEAIIKFPMSPPAHRSQETRNAEDNILNVENCRIVEVQVQNGGSRHGSLSEEEENLAVLRRHVMNELLETERAYVEELLCVLQGYAAEMDNPAMAHLLPSALLNRKDVLFGNMPEIYQFHKRTFLRELETYTDVPELVGRCFLERMGDLQIYEKYCQNKPRSESLWRQCSDCAFFQECQRKLEHKLGLDSYLLKPVQRITKYQLILKELLKYSKGCEGSEDLQEALSSILGILKAVNDSMHLIAITGYEGSLTELGRLLMQGSFSVWTEHKKGHAKVKDLARFKPMQRHLFLHEKALLFCKRREENGEGYEKAPSYSFKHSLNMSAVGITESAKGDNKKFEIWCNSREEVFIVQAATPEIKTSWLNEIRKVLTGQLKACRESSQKKVSDTMSPSPTSNSPPICLSPFRNCQKSVKKGEEKKTDAVISDPNSPSSPKHKEPGQTPHITLSRAKWLSTSSLLQAKRRGWNKASFSMDVPEVHDGYSSAEDPMNSDLEDEGGRKLAVGDRFTVVADYEKEKGGPQDLSVKSGDMVQLIKEGGDGQWFVRNLGSNKDGWVAAANLLTLITESKSSQSLCSSEGSVTGNLNTSSSCSETYTSFSDIKP
ncbi:guanine nucleotide exchange factor DBS isoform X4 [Oncorhynchus mykiss]|uniref:guanine nucleotide exchange factor DBS isoform X4 n=1 Tax=Oncorhynchus mykiss TaxID=8022 RepID=UPI001878D24D|nr:guanine nucleotide exchange factor DBS isoform X4 [Oncorhynchus mykiss]